MGYRLKGKVAVVSGSGRGIGRALAIALANEGAQLITNGRRAGTAESVAKEITNLGGQAVPFTGDISNFDVARKLIQTAVDEFGQLDILINNAGTTTSLLLKPWNATEEDWDTCIDSHLKGTFNCIRHACSIMMGQRWGRIINTSAIAWVGVPPQSIYGTAKAGIVGLTRAVARNLGRYGITCNAYCPQAETQAFSKEEIRAHLKDMYESGFMTKEQYEIIFDTPSPDEIILDMPSPESNTPLIVYLCTEEAADINGQTFDIHKGDISIYSEPVKLNTIHKEKGLWTVEELTKLIPEILPEGYKNPAPAKPAK